MLCFIIFYVGELFIESMLAPSFYGPFICLFIQLQTMKNILALCMFSRQTFYAPYVSRFCTEFLLQTHFYISLDTDKYFRFFL